MIALARRLVSFIVALFAAVGLEASVPKPTFALIAHAFVYDGTVLRQPYLRHWPKQGGCGGRLCPNGRQKTTLARASGLVDRDRQFTGKERDAETGLDYFGARYYRSGLGRFTSPARPFADQFVENPQSWNLYSYTRNNPLKYVDVDGNAALAAAGRWVEIHGAQLPAGLGRAAVLAGTTLIAADAAWENRDSIGRNVGEAVQQWGRANEFGPEAPRPSMSENAQQPQSRAPGNETEERGSKSVEDKAKEVSDKAGKNSVPYEAPSAKGHIDLAAKPHFDKASGKPINTPHVQERPKHIGPDGKVNLGKQTTRPATHQDVRTAERLIREKEKNP